MTKLFIFVEGKADVIFLRDFLSFCYKDLEIKFKKNKNYKLDCNLLKENLEIKIIEGGGYTLVESAKTLFENHIVDGYKIIVIQDADNPNKQDGGVELRLEYLLNIKRKLNLEFEVFLFPNNEKDGDLETLLLQIVNQDYFAKSFNCYKKYSDCVKQIADIEFGDELLEDKNLIFNYFRTFNGMENAKEVNRIFNEDYWCFTSETLSPLKSFLEKLIN